MTPNDTFISCVHSGAGPEDPAQFSTGLSLAFALDWAPGRLQSSLLEQGGGGGETHLFLLLPGWADAESVLHPWIKVVGSAEQRGSGREMIPSGGLRAGLS